MSEVQSVLISKDYYPNIDDAINKIHDMGFNTDYGIDEGEHYWRFRQFPPSKKNKHITKTISKGVKFIIEFLKK